MKTSIGSVIFHERGTNPYKFSRTNGVVGGDRVWLLHALKNGELPKEWAAWSDTERAEITDPSTVDWSGLRPMEE